LYRKAAVIRGGGYALSILHLCAWLYQLDLAENSSWALKIGEQSGDTPACGCPYRGAADGS
jgi:hypothetical protein